MHTTQNCGWKNGLWEYLRESYIQQGLGVISTANFNYDVINMQNVRLCQSTSHVLTVLWKTKKCPDVRVQRE